MLDKFELRDYRESKKDYWDLYVVTETAEKKGFRQRLLLGKEEGLAEGMEKGMEKGRAEEKLDNARKMKSMSMDSGVIASITGLSLSDIELL